MAELMITTLIYSGIINKDHATLYPGVFRRIIFSTI